MDTEINKADLEKEKSHIIVEIIQYVPHAVLSKTIITKTTGNITVFSVDTGETLAEKISFRYLHSNHRWHGGTYS